MNCIAPVGQADSRGLAAMSGKGKTRILLVNDHLGWNNQIHGVTRLFQMWATHLDPQRYEATVCILNRKSGLSRELEEHGVRTIFIEKGKYNPVTVLELVRIIKRERIDVLHLQAYRGTTFGRLAARLADVPVVVHFHDTNDFYPLVQSISDKLLRRRSDIHLAVSVSARDCWARRYRLNPEEVRVLYNCAPLAEFRPPRQEEVNANRRLLGISPNTRVVGTVTRLFPVKGTRYLLEAAPTVLARFPDTTFVIVGDGPLRQELAELADHLGVKDRVVFAGFVPRVAPIIGTFDLMVITSHTEGGSPLPALEAMAMGKAIVTSNVVEVIDPGVSGIVIPPRDPALLAEKIISLMECEEEARRLGNNAMEASKRFDVRRYVQALGQIYDSLAKKAEKV